MSGFSTGSIRLTARGFMRQVNKLIRQSPTGRTDDLLNSVPVEIRGPILFLKGEDHYVRVVTEKGNSLLLMRLRDAISRLGNTDGLKAHRSYWVSRIAFHSVFRSGHRRWLTLNSGEKLPVSESGYQNIINSGWLKESVEETPRINLFTKCVEHKLRLGFAVLAIVSFLGTTYSLNGFSVSRAGLENFNTQLNQNSNAQLAKEALRQGRGALQQDTKAGYLSAISSFEKALELDPTLESARENLALAYYQGANRYWSGTPGNERRLMLMRAYKQADRLNKTKGIDGSFVEALFNMRNGRFENAVAIAERAYAGQPNDIQIRLTLAAALTSNGEPDKAVKLLQDTLSTDPSYPASVLWQMGFAMFSLEKYDQAVLFLERALIRSPDLDPVLLIAAYGHEGKITRAKPLVEMAQSRLRPGFQVSSRILARSVSLNRKDDFTRLIDGLRLAGVS